jgi:hypothetical protein
MKSIRTCTTWLLVTIAACLLLATAADAHVPCKAGEVRTPDGRCLMPACPPGQVYFFSPEGNYCDVPLEECIPGRPCAAQQTFLQAMTMSKVCRPIHFEIELACLPSEGCEPSAATANTYTLTVMVKCSR